MAWIFRSIFNEIGGETMNSELKVIKKTLDADDVTAFELDCPCYEVIAKNWTDGDIYVYIGQSADNFSEDKAIKILSNMGQLIFMNNVYKLDFSFDKIYVKSTDGGEVEIQAIGF